MLRPSYTDLMDVLQREKTQVIASRYTVVIAASKRARQLIDKQEPLVRVQRADKPVSIAVRELYESKIKIVARSQDYDDFVGEGYTENQQL